MGESLEAQLAKARGEVARLLAENAELKSLLVEVQHALDAANADVARYREQYEQSLPNRPERVPSGAQQAGLEALLTELGLQLLPIPSANDTAAADDTSPAGSAGATPDATPPSPSGGSSGDSKPPSREREGRGGGRKEHGRRQLNLEKLDSETVYLDPPEVTAAGGKGYTLIGVEASNRVAFRPRRYVRLCIVRRTYRMDVVAAADGAAAGSDSEPSPAEDAAAVSETAGALAPRPVIVTAPVPASVWPLVMADPSAIAHCIVSKYDDLLPAHRQEGISRREGFTIPRSTLCNWFGAAHSVLFRIVDAMFEDGKTTAFCMATDATGARVRTDFAPCDPWKVFVFVADQDHVVFRHSRTHDAAVLQTFLKGYRGYLLGDAASIYSPLVTAGLIVLVCCWAHVRRYFYKALQTERARATEAIAIIGKLFEVERSCAGLVGPDKTTRRAELAAPVLKLFDDWLQREKPRAEERTPLKAAITYAENQREDLRRFLDDGRLRLDNNVCEGLLRKLVLGLNNWQYFENETGLRWYTTFRSLIASCRLHGLCPERYLECVLRLAPHWSQRSILELSPKYWRATVAKLTPEQIAIARPSWSTALDHFMVDAPAATGPSSDRAA